MATLGGGAPNTPYARRRVDVRLAEQAVHRRINIATVTTMENIVAHHNPTLYGGSKYTLHQIFIAFLYFLTHNMSYRKLEMETGLPHSNMKQWFGTIRRILLPYCLQQVSVKQTANDRLNIAQQVDGVRTENTVIVDGIHFQVANGHGNEQYLGNSFKLKKPARSFQVAINRARKVVFISSGYGANVHDIAAWREAWPNFVQVTGFDVTREKVVADAGYQGMPHHITPKKKPRNGNLSSEEQRWNTNIATKRSLVEQLFGGVKNMFRFLDKAFNGTVERFDDLVVLAFAIFEWNLMICANIQPNVLNIPQGTAQAAPVQAQYMQVPPPAPTVAPAPTTSAPVLQGPLPPLSAHIYRAVQVRPSQGPQGPAVAPAAPIQGPTPAPRQQPAQVPPNFQRPEQRSEQRPAPAPRQQPIQGALPAAPIQGPTQGPTQGSAQGSTSGSAAQAQRVGNGGNVISTPPVNLSQLVSFLRLN